MNEKVIAVDISDNASKNMRKIVFSSLLGNALEWYDFFLYGTAAALVFGPLFFPAQSDPLIGTLLAFSGFAIGFIARPLGGIFFGHIGDKYSHKMTLIITLVLMGASTFIIGVLPTYPQAGLIAPTLLILMRFIQGVASGGEWGGGVLMLSENAPEKKKGFYTAWSQVGVSGGFVLSALAFYLVNLLPHETVMAWAWRLPFLASIVIFVLGIYIRKNIKENPDVVAARARRKAEGKASSVPLMLILKRYPLQVLQAIGLRMPENGAIYIFFTFSMAYGQHIGLTGSTIVGATGIAMTVELFAILFWGSMADKIGFKTVYYIGVIGLLIIAFPFFWLLNTGVHEYIMLAMILGLPCCHGAMIGAQPFMMGELFPTEARYTGLALGHELGALLAGGFGPMIAVALLIKFNASWPVSLMLIVFAVIAIITLVSIRSDKKSSQPSVR